MRVLLVLLVVVVVTTGKQSQLPGLAWSGSLTKVRRSGIAPQLNTLCKRESVLQEELLLVAFQIKNKSLKIVGLRFKILNTISKFFKSNFHKEYKHTDYTEARRINRFAWCRKT